MMNITVRPAGAQDVAVICEYNRLLAKETENKDLDLNVLRPGVEAMLNDPHKGRYFVAVSDAEVVGQLGVTGEWSDWRNGDFWWVQSVYVVLAWRRRGVFRRLFEHLLQVARAEPNVIGVRLYVEHDNRAAQETYRQLGLKVTDYHLMEKYPLETSGEK